MNTCAAKMYVMHSRVSASNTQSQRRDELTSDQRYMMLREAGRPGPLPQLEITTTCNQNQFTANLEFTANLQQDFTWNVRRWQRPAKRTPSRVSSTRQSPPRCQQPAARGGVPSSGGRSLPAWQPSSTKTAGSRSGASFAETRE